MVETWRTGLKGGWSYASQGAEAGTMKSVWRAGLGFETPTVTFLSIAGLWEAIQVGSESSPGSQVLRGRMNLESRRCWALWRGNGQDGLDVEDQRKKKVSVSDKN